MLGIKPLATGEQVHFRPVPRELAFKVDLHKSETFVTFERAGLHILRDLREVLRENEIVITYEVVVVPHLSPYLVDCVLCHIPCAQAPVTVTVDRKEASVAGDILQIVLCVAGANEHTATLVTFDLPAVARTVKVLCTADKALDALHFHLAHTLKLRDLVDPNALDLLRCRLVLHVLERERIREPVLPELIDECALADAAASGEDWNEIVLGARVLRANDCR